MSFSTIQCAHWLATETRYRAPDLLKSSARSIADTIASAFAGAYLDVTNKSLDVCARYSETGASVIGRAQKLAAPWAAMVNGAAAHAAELDDNFLAGGTHGSAVLVPALLAQGEVIGSRGHAVLEAFALGLQLQWRLSQVMNPEHGAAGWHPTGTIAAVSAAGACARLAGLDRDQTTHALNMSASFMGGTSAQFGSMTKPLHAGMAAHAGVLCCDLAGAGVTAGPLALESTIRLMGGDITRGEGEIDYGATPALTMLGVTMKVWPTCGSTHPPVHALLKAKAAATGLAGDETILVQIPAILHGNLKYPHPNTADEAKFSLPFALATSYIDGGIDLSSLTSDQRARPAIQQACDRVKVEVIPNNFDDLVSTVSLYRPTGELISRASANFDELPGSLKNPLGEKDLIAKAVGCANGKLTEDAAKKGWDAVMSLTQNATLDGTLDLLRLYN